MALATGYDALIAGARSCVSVAVACAMAGLIAGCITVTGLAGTLINAIVNFAGDATMVGLVLTMLCCIILGMGVPTTANYCIMASTCAPILIQLGIPAVAAHFFVFYFGIVADITPPVALAAYAGSAIAKSNPMKTAFTASKIAIAAFIVPYIFAFNPIMLLDGMSNWWEIIIPIITSLVGLFGIGRRPQWQPVRANTHAPAHRPYRRRPRAHDSRINYGYHRHRDHHRRLRHPIRSGPKKSG